MLPARMAVGVFVAGMLHPEDVRLEYLCYVFVVPVMVVNVWEWFEPEVMEALFGKEEEKDNGQKGGFEI